MDNVFYKEGRWYVDLGDGDIIEASGVSIQGEHFKSGDMCLALECSTDNPITNTIKKKWKTGISKPYPQSDQIKYRKN